jgi:hypothetical protein
MAAQGQSLMATSLPCTSQMVNAVTPLYPPMAKSVIPVREQSPKSSPPSP